MPFRTWTWAVVVLAAVVLVGCDDKGTSANTTEGQGSTTVGITDPARSAEATSTTAPIDFDVAVTQLNAAIDDAEGDLCALVAATNRPLPVTPETKEQARQAVELIVNMVKSMGEVAEPADAKVYEAAAERLEEEAVNHDYSPEWLTGSMFTALDDPDFFEASRRLQERYQAKCKTTGTTVAPG